MNYNLVELFSYAIGIAALLGLVRIGNMHRDWLPFIILLWTGLANEIITTVVIDHGMSNAVNNNIYVLIESLLILWQFKNWNLFERYGRLPVYAGLFLLLAWIADNFFISSITRFSSYFSIIYSLMVVLLSITMINRVILDEKGWLLKNAVFLVCIGFIVFFAYKMIVELFWIYGLNASHGFRLKVYRIMVYINLAVNLVYAVAVLWIPRKERYTLF